MPIMHWISRLQDLRKTRKWAEKTPSLARRLDQTRLMHQIDCLRETNWQAYHAIESSKTEKTGSIYLQNLKSADWMLSRLIQNELRRYNDDRLEL